jgi:AcrR family transcriptional regulator
VTLSGASRSPDLSGPPSKQDTPKGAATRQRILARALELASLRGLESLTIGELASDLDLSKSGLFAHFKSKERLQLAVLEAAAEQFTDRVFRPAMQKPRGVARLGAIFELWLKWIRSSDHKGGCILIAAAMEWDDREGAVREAIVHWFGELEVGLRRAVQLAVLEGELRKDLPLELFASELHGVALKYHLDHRLLRSPSALKFARSAYERLLASARA